MNGNVVGSIEGQSVGLSAYQSVYFMAPLSMLEYASLDPCSTSSKIYNGTTVVPRFNGNAYKGDPLIPTKTPKFFQAFPLLKTFDIKTM